MIEVITVQLEQKAANAVWDAVTNAGFAPNSEGLAQWMAQAAEGQFSDIGSMARQIAQDPEKVAEMMRKGVLLGRAIRTIFR